MAMGAPTTSSRLNSQSKGSIMDVTGILSELRSELEKIEEEILFLEQFHTGMVEAAPHSVTETRWVREPYDVS
jgi:hypothetical protein